MKVFFSFFVLLAVLMVATPVGAVTPEENWFINQINSHRASLGLSQLEIDQGLTRGASEWADRISQVQSLVHDPNLGGSVCCWQKIGENLGRGYTLDQIWELLLSSPSHRATIEDPAWTKIGVAVVTDADGQLWTVHRFMLPAAPVPTTVAPRATTPPPAPSTMPSTSTAPVVETVTTTTALTAPSTTVPPQPTRSAVSVERIMRMLEALGEIDL